MKIPIIKNAVESFSLADLQKAEADLYDEKPLSIEIEGKDDGEKLTHVLAAIFIKTDMAENNCDLNTSLRKYTQKVRNSIN